LDKAIDLYDLPQDDVNLILGGTALKVFRIEDRMPHKRIFKQYLPI
jgi:hypothetical protein